MFNLTICLRMVDELVQVRESEKLTHTPKKLRVNLQSIFRQKGLRNALLVDRRGIGRGHDSVGGRGSKRDDLCELYNLVSYPQKVLFPSFRPLNLSEDVCGETLKQSRA